MCVRGACPAEETDLAWTAVKVSWRCLVRTSTGMIMKPQSNGSGSCWKGHSGIRGASAEDVARPRSLG